MHLQQLRSWLARLFGLLHCKQRDREFAEELESHLAFHIEDNIRAGMSPEEARRQALIRLGGVVQIRELHREQGGLPMLETLVQDVRYGTRMLRKQPIFTAMAVLSLALGIGANAAIFSLLDAVLLKSLPVRQPEQLVFLEQTGAGGEKSYSNIRYPVFAHLRDQNQTLSGLCAFAYVTRVSVKVDGQSEMIDGQLVTSGFFSVPGVQAIVGRVFTKEEDRENGGADVVVISHQFWQRRFNRNPAIVGQTVILNNTPFTIIGVTPPEFSGLIIGNAPEIFLPALAAERTLPRRFHLRDGALPFVVGRLKPEVTETQAATELTILARQAQLVQPDTEPATDRQTIQQQTMRLLPARHGHSALRAKYAAPLRVLMAVVGLVLLIACANVANLLLARAAARRREIAVRLAIGAGRWRLLRQLLTESLLLALPGGGLGLLLAVWGRGLLLAVVSSGRNPVSANTTFSLNAPLDSRVLAFTVVISLLAVLLSGLLPAWQATRLSLSPALRDKAADVGGGRFGWGSILVIAQIALSLTLLIGAGLFLRSLNKLQHEDIGFTRENVLVFSVHPQLIGYEGERIARLYEQMLERIGVLPGVRSATLSRQGLLAGGGTYAFIEIPGRALPANEGREIQTRNGPALNTPNISEVGPRFFETTGMTLLRGRDFTTQDHATARKVAVVDESFARYYFGAEDPVGQHFVRDGEDDIEIVGLVKDAKQTDIQEDVRRTFYVPYWQDRSSWRETNFQVRTVGDPLQLATAIRRAAQELEPNLSLFRMRTLAAQVDASLGQQRLVATLSALFGALALLLASAGLFGVLSYTVSRRTHEFGIRMALGAPSGNIRWLVLCETSRLMLCGIALGILASLASGRLIAGMLYGLVPADPLTILFSALILLAVAALASWIPAGRATKVDPMVALRQD